MGSLGGGEVNASNQLARGMEAGVGVCGGGGGGAGGDSGGLMRVVVLGLEDCGGGAVGVPLGVEGGAFLGAVWGRLEWRD